MKTDITQCAIEIAQILEKYNVTAGAIESVLNDVKNLILNSTPISTCIKN